MLSIKEVIVVEGKYDKEKLKRITDAPIVCTHGFEIYRSKKIVNTIKTLAKDRGVIILTDSDRAGFRIRNYLKQCLGDKIPVKNAYVPQIEGKERRKNKAGADGILGVEGIDDKIIEDILKKAAVVTDEKLEAVSKAEFYADGFSGKDDSADKRKKLAKALNLPATMSANALLDIINKAYGRDAYKEAVDKIF